MNLKILLNNHNYQKLKRKLLQNVWIARTLMLVGIVLLIILLFIVLAKPVWSIIQQVWRGPKAVTTFFTDPLYTLPSYEARTNILFIGMGGEEHDGGDLTDTIIFVALDLKHDEVSMLSIPRDIWVPTLETKINAAYAIGKKESEEAGFSLLEDAVYEIIDQPIHYVVGLDFNGFKELVDAIGGVDVKVDRAFVDEKYPIKGMENDECGGDIEYKCRYEVLKFETGVQNMNGETALKFSRSRHAEGDEGTDYARSLRQQKVIGAIKNKISQKSILLNPKKLLELKAISDKYIKVNPVLSDEEYAGFASFGVAFWRSGNDIKTITLDQGTDESPGFLVNPPIEKYESWVLEPRGGSWDEFQGYFKQVLQAQ